MFVFHSGSFARAIGAVAAVVFLGSCSGGAPRALPADSHRQSTLAAAGENDGLAFGVMTYNVDEGTDYLEVLGAQTQTQFLLGVGQLIGNVRATNPPERMAALARQIEREHPDVVSLQEVTSWSTGSFNPRTGACGPVTVEFDLLQELLDALASQGKHYRLVVQAAQLATPPIPGFIPPGTFLCAQLVNRIALLARTVEGGDRWAHDVTNIASGHYVNRAQFTFPGGSLPASRAWVSADIVARDRTIRVVGTHLESFVATIRRLQGAELRGGPTATNLPVVIAMDSNAQANPDPIDPAYTDFLTGGFVDAWTDLHPSDPGFTCCQAPLVDNPVSELTHRIDLILTRGAVGTAERIRLAGADPSDRTASGLWPSDHAGVAAEFRLEK